MDEKEVIRRYFSKLGSKMSPRKAAAIRDNARKAQAAHASPVERLERAYKAVKNGKASMTNAAIDPGKCSYYTLRKYAARRDAGETMEQIKGLQ